MTADFTPFTNDANFCIYFKIVHNKLEVEEDIKSGAFHPDFVHQFFVESERIFGYKNPLIKFFYTPSRLKRFFRFEYEDKLSKDKDGIDPDNVMDALKPVLEDIEYTQDINQFIKEVESEDEKKFKPCGDLIGNFKAIYKTPRLLSRAEIERLDMAGENHSSGDGDETSTSANTKDNIIKKQFSKPNEAQATQTSDSKTTSARPSSSANINKTYHFYHANHETKGFGKVQSNMQSLIMWFIESATMIDYTDPRWDFFIVYEKFNPNADDNSVNVEVSTDDRYYFCGYATVYRYYAYPDKMRPRISQILIMPPYRRNGIGTALLDSIYNHYKPNKATLDITVEDPDEEFIVMRDFLDCKNCLKLDSYKPDRLKEGWSKEMGDEAQEKLKLCRRQARKVYEILKLKSIDQSNENEFTAYRLEIKNRLNVPNQRMKLDCDKVLAKGFELPEELLKQKENQKLYLAQLDENFQELCKQYNHTIDKLNKIKEST